MSEGKLASGHLVELFRDSLPPSHASLLLIVTWGGVEKGLLLGTREFEIGMEKKKERHESEKTLARFDT